MALSKKNPAGTNQLENFISSSQEKSPQTVEVEELERLIRLLIDLQILKAPKKKKQEPINPDRDYISDSESIGQNFVAGERDLEEPAALISNRSETLPEKLLPVEERSENSSSDNIDVVPPSLAKEKAEYLSSKDVNVAPSSDKLVDGNGKVQSVNEIENNALSGEPNPTENKLNNSGDRSQEQAETVLLALLSALNIKISDRTGERSAESEVSESNLEVYPADINERSQEISQPDLTALQEDRNSKIEELTSTLVDSPKDSKEEIKQALPNLVDSSEDSKEEIKEVIPNLVDSSEDSKEKIEEALPNLEGSPEDSKEKIEEALPNLVDSSEDSKEKIEEALPNLEGSLENGKEVIPNLVTSTENGIEEIKEIIPNLVTAADNTNTNEEIAESNNDNIVLVEDSNLVQNSIQTKPEELSPKSIIASEYEEGNVEELYDAYKRLQSALIGPDLEDLQSVIAGFEQKVRGIEHQIYDPQELVNLLLPVISEILSRKVSESTESRESVVEAMVPIVDEIIQLKTEANREAMGKAIASALPVAITEEVHRHPEEFANAIAPGMAAAIDEQIKLDRVAMVKALYPIIHEVIHSKREEDIEAISAAIAPLLPPAIAEQIRNSPQEIAQAIGPEMAAAIREQIRLNRSAMIEALAPEMGKAIKAQIELERDAMVDALYPVIGSTIAKYMADVVRTINEKIENTLSMEGINRKIRAAMQGVSEGELIVKESVPFKVRAVFLIHKQSGLVVSEVQNAGEQQLEADMVAGMLTAIRSFVNDCIAQSGDVSEIDAIDYGNSKIILEVAGYCYLAVVTQGETPQWFISRMQQTLQTIVEIAGNAIENYQGDPTVIPKKVNEILENLANIKQVEKKQTKPPGLLLIGSLAAGLILIPSAYFYHRHTVERGIEEKTAQALASAPELAVYRLSVNADNDKLQLSGKLPNQYLRQRAAEIARQVAPDRKLTNQIIAVEVPPDPILTASEVKRVTAALNQIDGIAITSRYAAGRVTVEGTVGQAGDAGKITQAFKQIPGVKAITNTVQLQQLYLPVQIYFDAGKTELKAENKDKILKVKAFLLRYPETTLTIIGHSDTKGSSNQNQRLALLRAETVRQALVTEGVNPKRLQAVATPNPPLGLDSSKPLWLSRCVRFQPVYPGFQRK